MNKIKKETRIAEEELGAGALVTAGATGFFYFDIRIYSRAS